VARKTCTDCGEEPKRPGHPLYCLECWLYRQPVQDVQVFIRARLAAIPPSARRSRVAEKEWPPGRRWCSGCQAFVRLRDCGKGASRCRICASTASHGSALASTYTLGGQPFTEELYQRLYRLQDGRCYVCHRRSPSRRLAVDHDHRTLEVRGLLCPDPEWGCNLKVVARFDADDDPVAMAERLVEYLRNPPAARLLLTA